MNRKRNRAPRRGAWQDGAELLLGFEIKLKTGCAVCPGDIDTPMLRGQAQRYGECAVPSLSGVLVAAAGADVGR